MLISPPIRNVSHLCSVYVQGTPAMLTIGHFSPEPPFKPTAANKSSTMSARMMRTTSMHCMLEQNKRDVTSNADLCNLDLRKDLQTYTPDQVVPIVIDIRAPHTGPGWWDAHEIDQAYVSCIDFTMSNSASALATSQVADLTSTATSTALPAASAQPPTATTTTLLSATPVEFISPCDMGVQPHGIRRNAE
ncbi:hypothetical protein FS749_005183 [Ceratobasidium sp. UAMH 11750]|nr:hypothetical protein FS749_005183 [Ceratobasidium sp. UAMH 11750]